MKTVKGLYILFIVFILCACSYKENESSPKEWGVINGKYELHKEGEEMLYSVKVCGKNLLYKTTASRTDNFRYIDLTNNFQEYLVLKFERAYVDVLDYAINEHGDSYYILLESRDDKENIYLNRFDKKGEEERVALLNDFHKGEADDCYGWKLIILEDNILVYSELGFWLLDDAGQICEQKEWDSIRSLELVSLKKGEVLYQYYENGDRAIINHTIQTDEEEELTNIPLSIYFDFSKYGENLIAMRSDAEACVYHTDTGEIETLFRWSDYGLVGDNILKMYSIDGELHCLIYENGSLYHTGYKKDIREETKVEIILGCVRESRMIREAVARFNNTHDDYMIKVIDYNAINYQADNEEAAVNDMYHAILSGGGPDIIKIDSDSVSDIMLAERGMLENLNQYIQNSTVISREDFIESVYEGLQYKDNLYMLPTNFALETIITKNKWLEQSEEWTTGTILKIMEESANTFLFQNTRNSILKYCALVGINTKVSLKENVLEADCLGGYIKLASRMPETVTFISEPSLKIEGKVLFETCSIEDMMTYQYMKAIWGGDASYTGFPNTKGNGMIIIPLNSYGINKESANKEKAWEFIESFFTDEWQEEITPNYDFSVYRKKWDKQMEEAIKVDYYFDRDGKRQEVPILQYPSDGDYIPVYAARKEDVENFKDMVYGSEVVKRDVSHVTNMIQEEAAYYFAGQKALEEVIESINNRLSTAFTE